MIVPIPSIKAIHETREKFYQLARTSYPDVGEPAAVWVLAEVLGWDMDRISRVSVDGFSRDGYRMFVVDEDGNRVVSDDEHGRIKTVTRKWTKKEKSVLKEWWWLLGL